MSAVLVDASGVVVGGTGQAWTASVIPPGLRTELGHSLIDACTARLAGGDGGAALLRSGLQAVLAGRLPQVEVTPVAALWRAQIDALVPPWPAAALVTYRTTEPSSAELERLRAALRVTERRLTAVQRVAGLASWSMDLDSGRLQFSPESYDLLGLDPAQGPIGSEAIRRRVHPDDLPRLRDDRRRTYAGEPLVASHFRFRRDDGRECWLESRVTLERSQAGQPGSIVGTVRDVTDTMRTQQELEQHRDRLEDLVVSRTVQLAEASERAEAAGRAKSAFLAHTSHEIRTPLNVIVSLAHLMQRAEADPSHIGRVQAVESAARHLSSIIDDLLDLARAEGRHLTLHNRPLRPLAVLDEVATMLRPQARLRGLHIEVESTDPQAWESVRGDPARLRQALLNAGRWAIGAAPMPVTGADTSARNAHVRLRLLAGPAVDARVDLRLEVDSAAPVAGASFDADADLAALRRLARLMNGRCGVDAGAAGGSRCWFRVDLELDSPDAALMSAPVEDTAAQLRQRHAGRRVLVAEDDDVNQLVMVELLLDVGLQVATADDGQQALDLAMATDFALIVLDLRMPRLDGLAAARAIRDLPGRQHTPIVAITANAFEEDRAACRAAGMNDFLPKPVDVERLYDMLLRWLDTLPAAALPAAAPVPAADWADRPLAPARGGAPGGLAGAPGPGDELLAPLLGLEGVDAVGGLGAVGGKVQVYRRLLHVFINTHCGDGARLRQLLRDADSDAVSRLAHRLRGSAATLGLVDIETAAAALEQAIDEPGQPVPVDLLAQAVEDCLADTLDQLRAALAS